MKKLRPAAAFLLVLILVFSSASPAFAKDLEPCYHCGSTGRFECPNCHNQVQITCDGCNGAGGSKCDGEEGKVRATTATTPALPAMETHTFGTETERSPRMPFREAAGPAEEKANWSAGIATEPTGSSATDAADRGK